MTTSLRCGSGLLVACLLTSAQAAEYSPDQFLFGDWNGARTRLHEAGVDLQITYVNELARNTQGGGDHTSTYADQRCSMRRWTWTNCSAGPALVCTSR